MSLSRRSILGLLAAPSPAVRGAAGAPELAERRRRLADRTGGGVICLLGFTDEEGASGFTGFRQESNFLYLTGHSEPGAALVVTPATGRAPYREVLFLPARNEMRSLWTGRRLSPEDVGGLGFQEAAEFGKLPAVLRTLVRERGPLRGVRPRPSSAAGAAADRSPFQRLTGIAGGSDVRDISKHLVAMRTVKSPEEIALLRAAVRATEASHKAAWRAVRPGAAERSVAAEFVAEAFRSGCERLAFPPMAGSGSNAAILHYQRNDGTLRAGDLLLIDAGGERSRYAADLARTVPVNGRFTDRQRRLHEAVRTGLRAAVGAARPGAALSGGGRRSLRSVAERAMRAAAPGGVSAHLPHAVGHHVGLDVHDLADPRGLLKPGMVLAIEPGLYVPDEGLGIRIEDMIEITVDGCELMSDGLPASADEIERAFRRA